MSRRTKLIVLSLFVALLAIPAVYLVFSPAPENPLRFHVVWDPTAPGARVPDGVKDDSHLMIVENMSASPVFLQKVLFVHEEEPSLAHALATSYTLGMVRPSKDFHSIPPMARVRIPVDERNDIDGVVFGGLEVTYYAWTTGPRLTARRTMQELWAALPESLGKLVPNFSPHIDAAPVTVLTKKEADKLMHQAQVP